MSSLLRSCKDIVEEGPLDNCIQAKARSKWFLNTMASNEFMRSRAGQMAPSTISAASTSPTPAPPPGNLKVVGGGRERLNFPTLSNTPPKGRRISYGILVIVNSIPVSQYTLNPAFCCQILGVDYWRLLSSGEQRPDPQTAVLSSVHEHTLHSACSNFPSLPWLARNEPELQVPIITGLVALVSFPLPAVAMSIAASCCGWH